MTITVNLFNSVNALEPRCPKCGSLIDYGVTTRFDEEKEVHVCLKCGTELN